MDNAPSTMDTHVEKRKVPAELRQPQILALQAAGITMDQIADIFNVSRKTIERDLEILAPARENFNNSTISELMGSIKILLKPEDRALRYVELATKAKNEAVSLGALQRIDDLDGIVTQKELVRTRRDDAATTVQPMFVLPAGSHISVTVDTTTYSNKDSSSSTQEPVRNVTPSVTPDTK